MDGLNFFDIMMGVLYGLGAMLSLGVVISIVLHYVKKSSKEKKKDYVTMEAIDADFVTGELYLLFEVFVTKNVVLELTNFDGETMKVLAEGEYKEGIHRVKLISTDFPDETYFYKLTTDNQNINKKIKIKNNS